jgi:hypothetical protein
LAVFFNHSPVDLGQMDMYPAESTPVRFHKQSAVSP